MTIEIDCCCCEDKTGRIIYSGLTSVYSTDSWNVIKCENCGNISTNPVPSKELLDKIYSTVYMYPVHLLALGEKKMRARSLASYVKKIHPPSGTKNILEAGCMYGYLLNELKDSYYVKGIDIGEESVNFCKSSGLDVTDISIETFLNSSKETFDIIILSHVFEHLVSPDETLEQLSSILNPGGKIVISVPNSNSVCRKFFGRYWGWWQVPVHVNHFREIALRKMAEKKNLVVEDVRYKGGDSLMLLLCFINLFGFRSKDSNPGVIQQIIIKMFTIVFRYWYYLSNEELTVVLRKN